MLLCQQPHISAEICASEAMTSLQAFVGELARKTETFSYFLIEIFFNFLKPILASVHKDLRFCDLCEELSFSDRSRCHGEGRVRSPSGPSILAAHKLRPHRRTGRLGDPALPIQPSWMSNPLQINGFYHQFLESVHKYMRFCDLCKELSFSDRSRCHGRG